jgi:hypothetical protein
MALKSCLGRGRASITRNPFRSSRHGAERKRFGLLGVHPCHRRESARQACSAASTLSGSVARENGFCSTSYTTDCNVAGSGIGA